MKSVEHHFWMGAIANPPKNKDRYAQYLSFKETSARNLWFEPRGRNEDVNCRKCLRN